MKLKKFISVFCVICMLCAVSVSAFADANGAQYGEFDLGIPDSGGHITTNVAPVFFPENIFR